jgi:hypothetical protein
MYKDDAICGKVLKRGWLLTSAILIRGFFVSGIAGIGHNKFPLLISSQMNTTLTTTIFPDPSFKWNISLAYSF